jgi:uncharacterized protein YrzB (UPF0473 family)
MFYSAKDARESNVLKQTFGDEVILCDEGKDSAAYQVLKEFSLGDQIYAVLHSRELSKQVEYVLFRVIGNAPDEVSLETIDDDEEWDAVAEVYDEMTFIM